MKRFRLVGAMAVVAIGMLLCSQGYARSKQAPVPPEALSPQQPPPVEDAQPVSEPQPAAAAAGEPSLRDVMAELVRLRDEVSKLRELIDAHLSSQASDLQAENERLREQIQTLSTKTGRALSNLPMPDKELLKGLSDGDLPRPKKAKRTEDAAPAETPEEPADKPVKESEKAPAEETQAKAESAAPEPPAVFTCEVVAEWGRTPADAAKSVPKAGSLKGMICVVSPGSRDEDLIATARKFHEQFASYDNINIEMFDDAVAARAAKDNRSAAGTHAASAHRVLSISKHGASGRDVILLIKGEQVAEVPVKE